MPITRSSVIFKYIEFSQRHQSDYALQMPSYRLFSQVTICKTLIADIFSVVVLYIVQQTASELNVFIAHPTKTMPTFYDDIKAHTRRLFGKNVFNPFLLCGHRDGLSSFSLLFHAKILKLQMMYIVY